MSHLVIDTWKDGNPGCECCDTSGGTGCGTIIANTLGCGGAYLNGGTITVKQGSTVIDICTTSFTGTCSIAVPLDGTYTVIANFGSYSITTTVTISGCNTVSVTFNFVDKLSFFARGCLGGISGVVATWTIGGTGVGTCTTDGTGHCQITLSTPILPSTSWSLSAVCNGRTLTDFGTGCGTKELDWIDVVCFHVQGCCIDLVGCVVTFLGSNGGTGTCTTDVNGLCCITPSVALLFSDTMQVTFTRSRYITRVITADAGCDLGGVILMSPDAGHFCCYGCTEPVSNPLTYTDTNTTLSITGVSAVGCAGLSGGGNCYGVPANATCQPASYSDTYVRVTFQCAVDAGIKTYYVTLSWIAVECLDGGTTWNGYWNSNYQPGTNPCGQDNPGLFPNTHNLSFVQTFTYPDGCPDPIALSGTWPSSKTAVSFNTGLPMSFPCPAPGAWSLSS